MKEKQKYKVFKMLKDNNFDISKYSFNELREKFDIPYAQALNNWITQLIKTGHIRKISKWKYELLNDSFWKENEFVFMQKEIERLRIVEEKYNKIKQFITSL